jgi:hypothetical protein
MRYIVTITKENHILYQGKEYDMPIKKPIIKEFSARMFNDPDPCLIHQSLVTQRLVDAWISQLGGEVANASLSSESYFIDLDLENSVVSIEPLKK